MNKKKIVYISGNGHSGSTLLDTILGSHTKSFSAGELKFFPDKGIKKGQFCACGAPVPDCPLWKKINNRWEKRRTLDLNSYIRIQNDLFQSRNILKAKKLLREKPPEIQHFLMDINSLYKVIFEVTKSDCIVDSSKSPGMIPILKELDFDITVIHLTRRFGHVLNSSKKPPRKKDLKAGIEHDMAPSKTFVILRSWLFNNLLVKKYSKGITYKRVKYEEYVDDLKKAITKIIDPDPEFAKLLDNRGPLKPEHLVAGNAIRMKDELYVAQKPRNTTYERLGRADRLLAKIIDAFY